MAKNLLFVQPVLTSYRVPLFDDLADRFDKVTVMAAQAGADYGVADKRYKFDLKQISWRRVLGFYNYPLNAYLRLAREHQFVVHFGDFKYLTLYYSLIAKIIFGTKVFVHGQGGYKKDSLAKRIAYSALVFLANGYIAYNEYAANSLKQCLPRFLRSKVSYVNNSLYLKPVEAINKSPNMEIAYIGRLREGSHVEMLAQACKAASLRLNVVGMASPEEQQRLFQIHHDIIFHGALFDEEQIKNALKDCLAGAYAGDAGLSVVHYMALGLPVVVHSDIQRHMGPEPAYVIDEVNGVLFQRGNIEALINSLVQLKNSIDYRNYLSVHALNHFNDSDGSQMGSNFFKIINQVGVPDA